MLPERGVGFFCVPRGVADLEGELERGWAKREKFFEKRLVVFEVGRKLDEDRAEVVTVIENACNFEKAF